MSDELELIRKLVAELAVMEADNARLRAALESLTTGDEDYRYHDVSHHHGIDEPCDICAALDREAPR